MRAAEETDFTIASSSSLAREEHRRGSLDGRPVVWFV